MRSLTAEQLNGDWESVCRPAILWAGGLKDLRDAAPGQGYTGFVHTCPILRVIIDRAKTVHNEMLHAYQNWKSPLVIVKTCILSSVNRIYTYNHYRHSFNDYNHCDLTAMVGSVSSNLHKGEVMKHCSTK